MANGELSARLVLVLRNVEVVSELKREYVIDRLRNTTANRVRETLPILKRATLTRVPLMATGDHGQHMAIVMPSVVEESRLERGSVIVQHQHTVENIVMAQPQKCPTATGRNVLSMVDGAHIRNSLNAPYRVEVVFERKPGNATTQSQRTVVKLAQDQAPTLKNATLNHARSTEDGDLTVNSRHARRNAEAAPGRRRANVTSLNLNTVERIV